MSNTQFPHPIHLTTLSGSSLYIMEIPHFKQKPKTTHKVFVFVANSLVPHILASCISQYSPTNPYSPFKTALRPLRRFPQVSQAKVVAPFLACANYFVCSSLLYNLVSASLAHLSFYTTIQPLRTKDCKPHKGSKVYTWHLTYGHLTIFGTEF